MPRLHAVWLRAWPFIVVMLITVPAALELAHNPLAGGISRRGFAAYFVVMTLGWGTILGVVAWALGRRFVAWAFRETPRARAAELLVFSWAAMAGLLSLHLYGVLTDGQWISSCSSLSNTCTWAPAMVPDVVTVPALVSLMPAALLSAVAGRRATRRSLVRLAAVAVTAGLAMAVLAWWDLVGRPLPIEGLRGL